MHIIHGTNPDYALSEGLGYLKIVGVREESRNGPVLVAPTPVVTVYNNPSHRVSFSALRDANPFFHLFEALWMLQGRNDVHGVAHYASRMREFSDDGHTLNGAYGFRWRSHFGYDQLALIIDELKRDPTSRRCVLAMWDATDLRAAGYDSYVGDLFAATGFGSAPKSKDVPCNTHAYFRVNAGRLDMTVCNRSNDIVWGAYGANVVHFSMLMEYMAGAIGVPMGVYYQFSNNYHAYIERPDTIRLIENPEALIEVPTSFSTVALYSPTLRDDLFSNVHVASSTFMRSVALPMYIAFEAYKGDCLQDALKILENPYIDWHIAGRRWLERRAAKRAAVAETRA